MANPYATGVSGDGKCIINNIQPRPQGTLVNFYRADTSGGTKTKLNDTPLDADGYIDNQTNGTTKYYSIKFVTSGVEGTSSSEIAITANAPTDTVPRKEWEFRLNGIQNKQVEHPVLIGDYVYPACNGAIYKVNIFNGKIERSYELLPENEWTTSWYNDSSAVYTQLNSQPVLLCIVHNMSLLKTRVVCVNEQTGERLWISADILSDTLVEGMAFDGANVYVGTQSYLRKISISDGATVWTISGQYYGNTPLYDSITNSVFIHSGNGYARKINATNGNVISQLSTPGNTGYLPSPLLIEDQAERIIIFIGTEGTIYKTNPDTFAVWERTWTVPDQPTYTPPPQGSQRLGGSISYNNGELYVQALSAKIYCLNIADFTTKWVYGADASANQFDNFWTAGALDEDYYYQIDHIGYNGSQWIPQTQYLHVINRTNGQIIKKVASSNFTNSCFNIMLSQGMLITGIWYSDSQPTEAGRLYGWKVRETGASVDSYTYRGSENRTGYFPQHIPLSSIVISPSTVTINSSQTQQFSTTGYDNLSNPIPFTPIWSCTGGTITQDGLFTPNRNGGSASVTCSDGGVISDTVNFIVTELPPVFTNPQWTFISGDLYFQGQISNIVTGDIITFQYSTDQLIWTDMSTTLMGNKYRANFAENGKSGLWYGRLMVSNNGDVNYYSDSVSIDLDSLAPKNPPVGYFTPINKPATFGSFKFGESIFAQEAIIEIINSINQTESNLIDFQGYLDNISSNNLSQSSILGIQLFLENVLSNDLTQSQIVDLRQHIENLLSQNNTLTSITDYAGYYEGIVSNNLSQSFVAIIREYLEDILSSELSESKVTIFQNYIEKIISNNITESAITDLQEFYGRFENLIDIVYSDSKIVDIQDYKDNIISDNNVQLQISELQNYIDNILSNNIDESIIDDIQQFVSNLEEILDITLSQSQVEEVQNYLEDITSKNLTRSIVIEKYITKLLKILVTLGYVVKFLKLRYYHILKPLRYTWKVVGTNVGTFKNGIYNVYVGEVQEVPIDIETNDINNTNFSVSGTYQYIHNDGTELDSGIAQSDNTRVFVNLAFTTPGSNQKLIYTYTCTQLDVDGNPKPDANVETGIAVIPINCEKP